MATFRIQRDRALYARAALASAPERKPFAYFQWNSGWNHWEQVIDSAAGREGVIAAYRHAAPERKVMMDAEIIALADKIHGTDVEGDFWMTEREILLFARALLNQQGEQTAPEEGTK